VSSSGASNPNPLVLIEEINPILRGWVKCFAMGHSSRCFAFIRDWVQKKIRGSHNSGREKCRSA
jgi:RNA-directed DNA polymerase